MNNKVNRIHERPLRLVYSDHVFSFDEFLKKGSTIFIHHRNIQSLAIEIYKIFQGLSPSIMKNVFHINANQIFRTTLGYAVNFIVEMQK